MRRGLFGAWWWCCRGVGSSGLGGLFRRFLQTGCGNSKRLPTAELKISHRRRRPPTACSNGFGVFGQARNARRRSQRPLPGGPYLLAPTRWIGEKRVFVGFKGELGRLSCSEFKLLVSRARGCTWWRWMLLIYDLT